MSRLPETGPSLRRIIEQERRRVGRAENSSPFSRSGSGVTGLDEVTYEGLLKILGQLVVDGTLTVNGPAVVAGTLTSADFDGDLATGDAGTTGWAMNAARAAVGELFLRPGSVGNDALANPVEVGDFDHTETVFDPPGGAWYTASSVTLTTPAGFTQAVVTAVAFAAIYNTAAADTTVHLRAQIAGANGSEDSVGTTAGQVKMLSMFPKRVISLTGGDTFVVACQTYSVTDFTAHATNKARISGTVLWLR